MFLTWLLNTFVNVEKTSNPNKKGKSIIEKVFQGTIDVTMLINKNQDKNMLNKIQALKSNIDSQVQYEMKNSTTKFFFLSCEIPALPLFKEQS